MSKGFCFARPAIVVACLVTVLIFSVGSAFAVDAPRLDGGKVTPTTGTTNTVFRFSIVYFGATEPSGHDVHIDGVGTGSIFSMTKVGAGPTGGTLYAYDTKLAAGTHQYRFHFVVGGVALRKPGPTGTNWYTGPVVTAAAETYRISGLIKVVGIALPGVEVHIAKTGSPTITVRTNAEGRFNVTGLVAGTCRITPAKAGYRMDPLSKMVTVPISTTTCNFKAIKL